MGANSTRFIPPASGVSETMGVLEAARCSCLTCSVSCQGLLNRGSSKHGKARRASVGSNWVYTYQGGFCPSRNWNTPALLEF